MYTQEQILSDAQNAINMGFEVKIDDLNAEVIVDAPDQRWSLLDDDADELLEDAQALGDQHENVTQRVAVLHLFYQKYQLAS